MKYFALIAFIALFMNSALSGQSPIKIYTSNNNDTLFFFQDEVLFKLKKKSFGYYYGYGRYKIKGSRLKIYTNTFPYKKSHYAYSKYKSKSISVKFIFSDISGKPIPNVNIFMASKGRFVGPIVTSDSIGKAIVNNVPSNIDYYLTNILNFNTLEIPFVQGDSLLYHVTLESIDIIYFENEKLVFKYKKNNDEIVLKILKPKGIYKDIELDPYIKFMLHE